MAINSKNRSELKAYFVKNAIPTEANFADLVDAQLNQADDGVFKLGDDPLSIVAAPGEQKRVLRLYEQFPASNPSWTLSLAPRTDPSDAGTGAPGLGIDAPDGSNRLYLSAAGSLGLGTTAPGDKLTVHDGDIRIEGGDSRRLKVVSDTQWAGVELRARNADGKGGSPFIDFTTGDNDFDARLYSPAKDKLVVVGAQLGVGRTPDKKLDVDGHAIVRGVLQVDAGLELSGNRSGHNNNDGALYRHGAKVWLAVDDTFYIRETGNADWGFHFDTQKSTLSAKGGLIVGEGNRNDHLDYDGAIYRKGGETYITVDNHLYIRDREAKGDEWTAHFNTNSTNFAVAGDIYVKGGKLHIGGWTLDASDEHLHIRNGNKTIARFSIQHDRMLVYRNLNGKSPYWFFNSAGRVGVH